MNEPIRLVEIAEKTVIVDVGKMCANPNTPTHSQIEFDIRDIRTDPAFQTRSEHKKQQWIREFERSLQ